MAKWWTLLAVCVATFMLLLDVTVVNVALPYIERDLHSDFTDLQWVVDAYALALAALLLTAGSIADGIGRRKVFVIGLGIFTAASALCGLATSPLMLNLTLFRKPAFDGASIAAFVLSAAMFAMFLYLTLYIQNILGYSALESGVRFMPVTLLSFAVAPISGKLADHYGVRWFIAGGLALVGIGLLLMGGL